MQLSILIPSLKSRRESRLALIKELERQANELKMTVQILTSTDNGELTIGYKRNQLIENAIGDYVCFIDDDDWVSKDYLFILKACISGGYDCCGLVGQITFNGINPKKFIHSLEYKKYDERDNVYYRPPNHLNCIKASIAKQFKFPEKNHSEDTEWCMKVLASGLIKTEYKVTEIIYFYNFKPIK